MTQFDHDRHGRGLGRRARQACLGLELGADDYLTKPFSPAVTYSPGSRPSFVKRQSLDRARRRCDPRRGRCTLDVLAGCEAELAGRRMDLTPTEFKLLATHARPPGRSHLHAIAGRPRRAPWGRVRDYGESDRLAYREACVRKLEPDPRQPRYVLTVYGVGYQTGGRSMTGSGPAEEPRTIDPEDWRAYRREMWRRRRADRRAGRNSRGEWSAVRPGRSSAVRCSRSPSWSSPGRSSRSSRRPLWPLGPIPVLIAALVVLVVLFGSSGPFRRSARVLNSIVEATRRVEGGDYATRVSTPSRAWRPITCRQSLARSKYLAGYFYERTRHNCPCGCLPLRRLAGRLSGLRECRRGTVSPDRPVSPRPAARSRQHLTCRVSSRFLPAAATWTKPKLCSNDSQSSACGAHDSAQSHGPRRPLIGLHSSNRRWQAKVKH